MGKTTWEERRQRAVQRADSSAADRDRYTARTRATVDGQKPLTISLPHAAHSHDLSKCKDISRR